MNSPTELDRLNEARSEINLPGIDADQCRRILQKSLWALRQLVETRAGLFGARSDFLQPVNVALDTLGAVHVWASKTVATPDHYELVVEVLESCKLLLQSMGITERDVREAEYEADFKNLLRSVGINEDSHRHFSPPDDAAARAFFSANWPRIARDLYAGLNRSRPEIAPMKVEAMRRWLSAVAGFHARPSTDGDVDIPRIAS